MSKVANKNEKRSSDMSFGGKSKWVKFSEKVYVYSLPSNTSREQWLSRFGPWKEAPFHDELWDGYAQEFREKLLTKKELAKLNREYKWKRRLPNKVFSLMFERGKEGRHKLAQSKDEVLILTERLHKMNQANQAILDEMVKPKRPARPKASLIKAAEVEKQENKVKVPPRPKGPSPIFNEKHDSTLPESREEPISDDEIDPNDVETAPRGHSFQEVLASDLSESHRFAKQDTLMVRDKKQILKAFEEVDKKRRQSADRKNDHEEANVGSEVSFEVEVDGKRMSVNLRTEKNISNVQSEKTDDSDGLFLANSDVVAAPQAGKMEEKKDAVVEEPRMTSMADMTFGVSDLVWGLRNAVASFFYTPHPEPVTQEMKEDVETDGEESDDEIDSVAREEVNAELKVLMDTTSLSSIDIQGIEEVMAMMESVKRVDSGNGAEKEKDKAEKKISNALSDSKDNSSKTAQKVDDKKRTRTMSGMSL